MTGNFNGQYGQCQKTGDGKLDYLQAKTVDELTDFVKGKLFVYLRKSKTSAESADTKGKSLSLPPALHEDFAGR